MSQGNGAAVTIAVIGLVGTLGAAFIGIIPDLGLFDQGGEDGGALPGWGTIQQPGGANEPGSMPGNADDPIDEVIDSGPASLFLSETSAPAGQTVNVSGEGFDPGEDVVIRVHTTEVATTEVDGDGSFSNVQITIPESLSVFAPEAVDVVATGASSIRSARKQITVT